MRRARTFIAAALAAAAITLPPSALAGEASTSSSDAVDGVVELFTSQGCSSCPPAEKVLRTLAQEPGIIALAYHVDYWDYIGWQDVFGSRANTDRQRAYAKAFNTGTIYTPQMVVNGQSDVVGSHEREIRAALVRTKLPQEIGGPKVELTMKDDHLHISAVAGPPAPDERTPVLMLITFDGITETEIVRGENKGKTLVNANPVRDWRILGMWAGKPLEIDIPVSTLKPESSRQPGCAAVLQAVTKDGAPGRILAAAMMKF